METPFELDEEQKQIKQKIFPYLKALSYELIQTQPKQIEKYMIEFLTKQGNYTTSGLTKAEKKELELLRVTVKHYRDLEKHNLMLEQAEKEMDEIKIPTPVDSDNSYSEENDDVMDEKEEEEVNKKLENIKKTQEIQNSIKSRVSVSAEAYGFYHKKENFVPKIIPKNEDQMNRIKGKIISSFIFSSLDKKDLDVVINAMEEKRYKLNENVIVQGDDGDCLYIVETGLLKCFKTFNKESTPKFLRNYEPGDSFGELALLYNCPRAATIVCSSEECILWSLDRETFNNIVKDAAQKKREKYENFLKNVDILSTIDSYELGQICDSLKEGIYTKDEYIIREGELGDVFYIIEEGECIATKTLEPGKPEVKINELKEGDYFGERALLKGEPRYANIVVSSETAKVISLDRLSFNRLLGPIIDILKRNIDKYQVYCANKDEAKENNNIPGSNTNSNPNINKDNLNKLNDILTSDNNNININNQPKENNLIDNNINNDLNNNMVDEKNNNELNNNINNENNNEISQSYNNTDINQNLNSIITSDVNNNNINNNEENDKKDNNNVSEKQENNNNENNNKENQTEIKNEEENKNENNNNDNQTEIKKEVENTNENNINEVINENNTNANNNLTSLQNMLTSNNEAPKENNINTNIITENESQQENNENIENEKKEEENKDEEENKNKEENKNEEENKNNKPEVDNSNPQENNVNNGENKEGQLESLKNMLEYKSDEN